MSVNKVHSSALAKIIVRNAAAGETRVRGYARGFISDRWREAHPGGVEAIATVICIAARRERQRARARRKARRGWA